MDFLKITCIITMVVLATTSHGFAQSQYAGTQFSGTQVKSGATAHPRMRIIEVVAKKEVVNHFTIAGAVNRSGVFTSDADKISLDELIQAANGVTNSERPSIRVIRGGQSRYSFTFDPHRASQAFVQANDIVIVLPKPGEQLTRTEIPIIPVVCVGLQERPVVLPLAPEIRTVHSLLLQLNQSPDLISTLRVIDPFARRNSQVLAPGTVVFFNTDQLSRKDLADVNAFPPSVPLREAVQKSGDGQSATSMIPEVNPNVPTRLQSFLDSADSQNADRLPPPSLFTSPELPVIAVKQPEPTIDTSPGVFTGEVPKKSFVNHSNSVHRIDGTQPIQFSAPPQGMSPIVTKTMETPDVPLLSDPVTDEEIAAEMSEFEPFAGLAPSPPEPDFPKSSLATRPVSGVDKVATRIAERTIHELSPQRNEIQKNPATVPENDINQKQASSQDAILPIAIAVGALGLICLGISIFWSMRERLAEQKQQSTDSEGSEKQANSIQSAHPEQNNVAQILSRSMTIIEEEVIFPSEITFHGEPIGKRRMIVHEGHSEVSRPHFAKKSPLPKRLRGVHSTSSRNESLDPEQPIHKTNDSELEVAVQPEIPATEQSWVEASETVHSVPPIGENQYDVVNPPTTTTPETGSALERALRILAKEKK